MKRLIWILLGGAALAAVVGGLWSAHLRNRAFVRIDSGYSHAVALETDGRPWEELPPGEQRMLRLAEGTHTLTVRHPSGNMLDERTVTVVRKGKYIWNPEGLGWYHAESRPYSTVPLIFGSNVDDVDLGADEWIDVSSLDFPFEPLPGSIPLESGESGGQVRRTGNVSRRPAVERYPWVWVDNRRDEPVQLEVDGHVEARIEALSHAKVRLAEGSRHVRLLSATGDVLNSLEPSCEPLHQYIFNPGGMQRYTKHYRRYGTLVLFDDSNDEPEDLGNAEWLDVTGVAFVLEDFPDSIDVQVDPEVNGLLGGFQEFTRTAVLAVEK